MLIGVIVCVNIQDINIIKRYVTYHLSFIFSTLRGGYLTARGGLAFPSNIQILIN